MPISSERFQKAKIIFRKDHTEDLWSIRVRPEHPISFKPGQYAILGIEEEGKVVERSYSICSSPHEPEVEFFFELVMRGRVTPPLYHRQVGDMLLMRHNAKGTFTFDGKSGHKNHLLVCTVTGVAPYISMARAIAREARRGAVPMSIWSYCKPPAAPGNLPTAMNWKRSPMNSPGSAIFPLSAGLGKTWNGEGKLGGRKTCFASTSTA